MLQSILAIFNHPSPLGILTLNHDHDQSGKVSLTLVKVREVTVRDYVNASWMKSQGIFLFVKFCVEGSIRQECTCSCMCISLT